MTVVEVRFDTDIFATLRKAPEEVAQEIRLAAAVRWYALGQVSQAKATEIAGISRSEFIDAVAASGISVSQESIEDIREALSRV
jgi:predicted HTH domain antitoxin